MPSASQMLIVDAYNVLHTPGVLPLGLAGLDLDGLAGLIARGRYRARTVVLVCDGVAKDLLDQDLRLVKIRVVNAGGGQDADTVIERMLRDDSAPRRLLVVSSDRRLVKAARRAGAQSLTSSGFLTQLAHDDERRRPEPLPGFVRQIPLSREAIAHWFEEFGLGPPPKPQSTPRPVPSLPLGSTSTRPSIIQTPKVSPAPGASPKFVITDLELLKALEEWGGGISPDDLDMRRWLEP